MRGIRTRLVSCNEWFVQNQRTGSVYFIKDDRSRAIKIGHSHDIYERLGTLQVGNTNKLRLIGAFAAPIEMESILHSQFTEYRAQGEWFNENGDIADFLHDITCGHPMCRQVCEFFERPFIFTDWDPITRSHSRHRWDAGTNAWVPPVRERPAV